MIRNIPSLSSDCQEKLKLALYYLNLAYDVDVIRYASPDSLTDYLSFLTLLVSCNLRTAKHFATKSLNQDFS